MSDLEQALGENPTSEAEPVAEAAPEVETKEAEQAEPVETPEAAEPAEDEPKTVPLAVFTSTRDELKAELRALKEAQQQRQEPAAPEPEFLDPEGATYLQRQVQQQVQNATLNMSEALARQSYGDEKVDAAFQALKAANDPAAHQAIMQAASPYDKLVKWHAAQTVISEIGTDPAAYKEKMKAEARAEIEAELTAKQVKEIASKGAPSLANVSGTGGGPRTTWTGPTPLDKILGE